MDTTSITEVKTFTFYTASIDRAGGEFEIPDWGSSLVSEIHEIKEIILSMHFEIKNFLIRQHNRQVSQVGGPFRSLHKVNIGYGTYCLTKGIEDIDFESNGKLGSTLKVALKGPKIGFLQFPLTSNQISNMSYEQINLIRDYYNEDFGCKKNCTHEILEAAFFEWVTSRLSSELHNH